MQWRSGIVAALLSVAMVLACQSATTRPDPSSPAPAVSSTTSCGTPVGIVGLFLFSGSLGIQNGIEARLRANELPVKVLWANRSAQPPRAMTIRIVAQGARAGELTMSAGWAPTPAQPSFPTGSPVTGYVSEIPTVPFEGCWEFSWSEGSASDRLALRVAP
jgi:hypothetical protein